MSGVIGWLADIPTKIISAAGSVVPQRQQLNFVSGATVADNPTTGSTDVTITGGPGGISFTAVWNSTVIPSGEYAALSITVTGATIGQTVTLAWNPARPSGTSVQADVTASNTVTIEVFNNTSGSVTVVTSALTGSVQ